MSGKVAVIAGAGPAGLTAAYELVMRTDIKPIVFEADSQVGGISKTVNYKGNRIDIGGHRFFSKSDRVMDWWMSVLPLQAVPEGDKSFTISYQNRQREVVDAGGAGCDPDKVDEVMLVRNRTSRILYDRKMYNYPLKFGWNTFVNLGLIRTAKIIASYGKARISPIRPEVTLRDFIVNRFGDELYSTFFRDYTEKVWGVPCEDIPADWGAQRIKGLSISELVRNMLRNVLPAKESLSQKEMETSLIERFLYPKFGPGQLWEIVAREIEAKGGEIHLNTRVQDVQHDGKRITSVTVSDGAGPTRQIGLDHFFSTIPVQDLFRGWQPAAPESVLTVSNGLIYRDFLTVGLLLDHLTIGGGASAKTLAEKVPDNWIYVQEPDVKVGRIQIFNNWSPYLVSDPSKIWMGLEYFVNEGDDLWSTDNDAMIRFAAEELIALGVIDPSCVLDGVVVRTPKAYPAYFGSYGRFPEVEAYTRKFDNLFCLGRNGMHRYNNQDHSMLTAMIAVDGLVDGRDVRDLLWSVNVEEEYHESK